MSLARKLQELRKDFGRSHLHQIAQERMSSNLKKEIEWLRSLYRHIVSFVIELWFEPKTYCLKDS